jgi:hypothetical protein
MRGFSVLTAILVLTVGFSCSDSNRAVNSGDLLYENTFSFEIDSLPSWGDWIPSGSHAMFSDDAAPDGGSYSLLLASNSLTEFGRADKAIANISGNFDLTISFWARSINGVGAVVVDTRPEYFTAFTGITIEPRDSAWTYYTATKRFSLRPDQNIAIWLSSAWENPAVGDLLVDLISIRIVRR